MMQSLDAAHEQPPTQLKCAGTIEGGPGLRLIGCMASFENLVRAHKKRGADFRTIFWDEFCDCLTLWCL